MAKLYPPVIEGSIPAFYAVDDKSITINIPFTMNRAVSRAQVNGFAVKVKTVQSSTYLYTLEVTDPNDYSDSSIQATFTDQDFISKLRIGQYYKIQIAYISGGDIGYYSTVGVVKYTTKPEVTIPDLDPRKINLHKFRYLGVYSQIGGDTTERVYTYRFDVFDSDGNIVETTGDLLHNSSNDTELNTSCDEYNSVHSLKLGFVYQIQYTVTTINKLTFSTPKYRVSQEDSLNPDMKAKLLAIANIDNGYVDLTLQDLSNGLNLVSGTFLLSRAEEMDDYSTWHEIYRWRMFADLAQGTIFRDFSVEQGKKYRYAIQQYNENNLFSNKIISNVCQADFEDAFLYDGHRQLKIRYNPKVSSFKIDVLETKTDTIGSKYPFVFRNGHVAYKEFPIGGLISYFSDEDNFFVKDKDIALVEKTTDFTSENMLSEREFKLQVLEWLNDGKPKLFRSPSEGNYIVRLLNTSLTPEDALGRMLHNFSCTAYEVAENNYDNLSALGIIHIEEPEPLIHSIYKTIELFYTDEKGEVHYITGELIHRPVQSVRFTDMMPGDKVIIDGQEFVIGVTGAYYLETGELINSIVIPEGMKYTGRVTLSTLKEENSNFAKVKDVQLTAVPGAQFYGVDVFDEVEKIILTNQERLQDAYLQLFEPVGEDINLKFDQQGAVINYAGVMTKVLNTYNQKKQVLKGDEWVEFEKAYNQFLKDLELYIEENKATGKTEVRVKNYKTEISTVYNIHARLRYVINVLYEDGVFYSDPDKHHVLEDSNKLVNQYGPYLYCIGTWEPGKPVQPGRDARVFVPQRYHDPLTGKDILIEDYDTAIYINGEQVDLSDAVEFSWRGPGKLDSLKIGTGVIAEIAYQQRNLDLFVEDDNEEAQAVFEIYKGTMQEIEDILASCTPPIMNPTEVKRQVQRIQGLKRDAIQQWQDYLRILAAVINEDDKRAGRIP